LLILSKGNLILLLVAIKGVPFNNPSLNPNFPLPLEREGRVEVINISEFEDFPFCPPNPDPLPPEERRLLP